MDKVTEIYDGVAVRGVKSNLTLGISRFFQLRELLGKAFFHVGVLRKIHLFFNIKYINNINKNFFYFYINRELLFYKIYIFVKFMLHQRVEYLKSL